VVCVSIAFICAFRRNYRVSCGMALWWVVVLCWFRVFSGLVLIDVCCLEGVLLVGVGNLCVVGISVVREWDLM